jgi:YggT family protein
LSTITSLIASLLDIYVLVLIVRLVFDYITMFARDWRPRGSVLVLAETLYSLTDPPLNAIRRVVPPLRLGGISIDLGFLILIFGISILRNIFAGL